MSTVSPDAHFSSGKVMSSQLQNVFADYKPTAEPSSFATPPKGCADMRPISPTRTSSSRSAVAASKDYSTPCSHGLLLRPPVDFHAIRRIFTARREGLSAPQTSSHPPRCLSRARSCQLAVYAATPSVHAGWLMSPPPALALALSQSPPLWNTRILTTLRTQSVTAISS